MSSTLESRPTTEVAFALFLLGLVGLLVGLSLTYSPTSRRFPLLIGVPTLVALMFIILAHWSPAVRARMRNASTGAFSPGADLLEEEEDEVKEGALRRGIAWTLGLMVGYFLFGFILTTPVFVYGFMTIEADHGRREAAIVAIGTTIFMVALFEFVLGTILFPGVLVEATLDLINL